MKIKNCNCDRAVHPSGPLRHPREPNQRPQPSLLGRVLAGPLLYLCPPPWLVGTVGVNVVPPN